ncbi:hypothetical protein ASE48_04985 [Mycobacterium sp. Root265]|nr:hypothetical protein ASE48_04985 [Mycobacterium sp. Root265]
MFAGAGTAVADDATPGPQSGSATSPAQSPTTGTLDGPRPDTGPDRSPSAAPDNDPEPAVGGPAAEAPETDSPADSLIDTPKKKKKNLTARTAAVTVPRAHISPVTSAAPRQALAVVAQSEPAVRTLTVSTPALTDIGSGGAPAARISSQPTVSLAVAAPEAAAPVQAAAPRTPSLLGWVRNVATSLVNRIGSVAINTIQALEALVTGPPSLPANSTVTVRNSTILLSNGQRLKANWYYPEGDVVPDKLIVLQHGLLALGPMYSHTAADLAASTGSIVVTPSIPSNVFAGDDHWLGGEGMAKAIADLFVGERTALTDSARAAGFAARYGLDPATAELPEKFGLAGHSLGGQLVSAAAGYLVDNGAVEDLVGVITLDGVPTGTTMVVTLGKLAAYEEATGRFIPIREIGAPSNFLNSSSNVKEALNEARPGRFNGVVLKGGVHMDSMRGGNPIIQFAAYIAAGFPKSYNQAAVAVLTTTWFTEWFAGDTDNGDDLVPGSTLPIATTKGTAQGVVIGRTAVSAAPADRFITIAV